MKQSPANKKMADDWKNTVKQNKEAIKATIPAAFGDYRTLDVTFNETYKQLKKEAADAQKVRKKEQKDQEKAAADLKEQQEREEKELKRRQKNKEKELKEEQKKEAQALKAAAAEARKKVEPTQKLPGDLWVTKTWKNEYMKDDKYDSLWKAIQETDGFDSEKIEGIIQNNMKTFEYTPNIPQ